MLRPGLFLALVAVFMATISVVQGMLPGDDPFIVAAAKGPVFLDDRSAVSFARLKRRHLLSLPARDVALFGNSRSLDVGAEHLHLGRCTFFNASLSGESLRASAGLLEDLAAHGKAPRVAVVSVDNFELQLYANPFFPPLRQRWPQAWRDLFDAGLRSDIAPREWLRMAWRHLYTESEIFRLQFEVHVLARALQDAGGDDVPVAAAGQQGYRNDGSRTQEPPAGHPAPLPRASFQVLPGYLAYDLERLQALAAKGTRVLLYESPLDPENARRLASNPSPYAAESRMQFLKTCERLGLTCHPMPVPLPDAHLSQWRDSNHAPAAPLGAYVSRLVTGQLGSCSNAL